MSARPFETHSHAPNSLRPAYHRHVELVPIRTLRPAARNARTHSKKQIRQIAGSIRQFGWTYAILIDEHGTIIAGHGRWKAAELLDLLSVPKIRFCNNGDEVRRGRAQI
jgi:hypothetical protein